MIGLLPFRNEAVNMPRVMQNLFQVCDEVLGYDSNSEDGSAELFLSLRGRLVESEHPKTYFEGGEHEIRSALLAEARRLECTHLIFLDCDEYFSSDFLVLADKHLAKLKPGEKLALEWVNLWGDDKHYCDSGIWKPRYKDFVMCDDGVSIYPYSIHHVSRTPNPPEEIPWKCLPRESGVVIHTQFVDQIAFQSKQILCRMSELLVTSKTPYDINKTYKVTSNLSGITKPINASWIPQIPIHVTADFNWRQTEILKLVNLHGLKRFEKLDIWNTDFMQSIWRQNYLRKPGVANNRSPLLLLKLIVYRIRKLAGYKFES